MEGAARHCAARCQWRLMVNGAILEELKSEVRPVSTSVVPGPRALVSSRSSTLPPRTYWSTSAWPRPAMRGMR